MVVSSFFLLEWKPYKRRLLRCATKVAKFNDILNSRACAAKIPSMHFLYWLAECVCVSSRKIGQEKVIDLKSFNLARNEFCR